MSALPEKVKALRERGQRTSKEAREFAMRMLDVVPGLQKFVNDLARIEVIDRAMVIGAQALLALIPLLLIAAAFLPEELTSEITDRFRELTGVRVETTPGVTEYVDTNQVRAQTGIVGILVTFFSAASFSRAIQRTYERTWQLRHIGGVRGLRRCLFWLVGWIVLLQLTGVFAGLFGTLEFLQMLERMALGTLVWWWSARMLLLGRVPWGHLFPGALIIGIATVLYSYGSTLVMPHYVASNAAQFGTLGLVLAVATWLIGVGFIVVVGSVLGQVLVADERLRPHIHGALSPFIPSRFLDPVFGAPVPEPAPPPPDEAAD